jgi:hypothetical protein
MKKTTIDQNRCIRKGITRRSSPIGKLQFLANEKPSHTKHGVNL